MFTPANRTLPVLVEVAVVLTLVVMLLDVVVVVPTVVVDGPKFK